MSSRPRRRPAIAVALAALVLLLLAGLAFGPALTRERTPVASTAAPPPFFASTPIVLGPGQEACATDVVLSPRTQVAEVILEGRKGVPSPPLEVRAQGPGYEAPPARIAGGLDGRQPARATIEPPGRELFGRLCLRNAGDTEARLVASEEFRTQARLRTTVDGDPFDADLALTFYEDRSVSVLGDLPGIVDRMTTFRGWLGGTVVVWALLVLVAAGVPLATLYVLYRGLAADETA